MIGRVRDRGTFVAFRSSGRRASDGPVTITFVPPSGVGARHPIPPEPRAAFAIGRKVGGAVVRNQVRRRLRAILSDRPVAAGSYLVVVRPAAAALGFDDLRSHVHTALDRLESPRPARRDRPASRAGDRQG